MKRSIFNVMTVFIVALSLALVMAPAKALSLTIDFGYDGRGGSITLLSGPNAEGEVPVNVLTVTGLAPTDLTYDLSGTFDLDGNGSGDAAVLKFNTGTGAVSIVGGVPLLSINDSPPGQFPTLLIGTISSFSISSGALFLDVNIEGSDEKYSTLLTALGIDPLTKWSFFGSSTLSIQDGMTSTDFMNARVPEPSLLLLLGVGLLGILALKRK